MPTPDTLADTLLTNTITELFQLIDRDRTNFVCEGEAKGLASCCGLNVDEFWAGLLAHDSDGDGKLSVDEFGAACRAGGLFKGLVGGEESSILEEVRAAVQRSQSNVLFGSAGSADRARVRMVAPPDDGEDGPLHLMSKEKQHQLLQRQSTNISKELHKEADNPSGAGGKGVADLRNFRVELTVAITFYEKKTLTSGGRRMVVEVLDHLSYRDFIKTLIMIIYGKAVDNPEKHAAEIGLKVFYPNRVGLPTEIARQGDLAAWRRIFWCRSPWVLQVYEGCSPLPPPDPAERFWNLLDVDASGTLDAHEVTVITKLCIFRESTNFDMVKDFFNQLFDVADTDENQVIDKDEFLDIFRQLDTGFFSGLLERPDFMERSLEVEAISTMSRRHSIKDATTCENRTIVLGEVRATDFGISMTFPAECLTDENAHKWVQGATIVEELVDEFEDPESVLGALMAPLVNVEFQPGTILGERYYITIPHSFHHLTADGQNTPLSKDDIVVVHSTIAAAEWRPLEEADFELLDPSVPEHRVQLPSIRARVRSGGVLGVYSQVGGDVAQRVIAVSMVPETVIPLQPDVMSIWLVPDLPSEIQNTFFKETISRGLVVAAGCSEPVRLLVGHSFASITVTPKSFDPKSKEEPVTRELMWSGDAVKLDIDFYPEDWGRAIEPKVVDVGDQPPKKELTDEDIDAVVKIQSRTRGKQARKALAEEAEAAAIRDADRSTIDIHDRLTAAYTIKVGVTSLVGRHCKPKRPDFSTSFQALLEVSEFPPPSSPLNLQIKTRTNTNLWLTWDPPKCYGGCAILHYELQLRCTSASGVCSGWRKVAKVEGWETQAHVFENVFQGEVRVRAINCGAKVPGCWSAGVPLAAKSDAEAMAAEEKACQRAEDETAEKARKAELKKSKSKKKAKPKVTSDDGMAVIEDDDAAHNFGKKKWEATPFATRAKMDGWTDFSRVVGEFFLKVGVRDGVHGKLFDLSARQIEDLVLSDAMADHEAGLEKDEPLIALAVASMWVVRTLAHHTVNARSWIHLLNRVSGLLDYVSHIGIGRLSSDREQATTGP